MKRSCIIVFGLFLFGPILFPGCGFGKRSESAHDREMRLGLVQKYIHKGMSQADVAEAIGSPNIVTKDSEEQESWIYDKIASEASYSRKDFHWALLLISGSRDSASLQSNQRTLTVVIKFDKHSRVKTLSYHSSKF